MTLFVLEKIDAPRHRKLFTVLGVEYVVTSRAWINPFFWAAFGIAVALVFKPVEPVGSQILVGLGYGILSIIASFGHGFGHIVSARIANAPMKSLVSTATVHVTYYGPEDDLPSRAHIGRALGGPLLGLALGLVSIAAYFVADENHFILLFGGVNLLFAAMTLSPLPSLDGAVILRELRRWKR